MVDVKENYKFELGAKGLNLFWVIYKQCKEKLAVTHLWE